jgi:hypothetical protein
MMVPISRKGGKLLFVTIGYVSRKFGFDKAGADRGLTHIEREGESGRE